MRIISLNTWGGRVHKPLLDFLSTHGNADIFCLQEVNHNKKEFTPKPGRPDPALALFSDIAKTLPSHRGFFSPVYGNDYGLAVFIKKNIHVVSEKSYFVHKEYKYIPPMGATKKHARSIQHITVSLHNNQAHIINFHGLCEDSGKKDSPDRLLQTKKIVAYIRALSGPVILCGDFNLDPDTTSLQLIEELPLSNLLRAQGFPSTRTSLYMGESKHADYIFASSDITVTQCTVLRDIVSDHAPLCVDIDL